MLRWVLESERPSVVVRFRTHRAQHDGRNAAERSRVEQVRRYESGRERGIHR